MGLYYWNNNTYSYRLSRIIDGKMDWFGKGDNRDVFTKLGYEDTLELALQEALTLI